MGCISIWQVSFASEPSLQLFSSRESLTSRTKLDELKLRRGDRPRSIQFAGFHCVNKHSPSPRPCARLRLWDCQCLAAAARVTALRPTVDTKGLIAKTPCQQALVSPQLQHIRRTSEGEPYFLFRELPLFGRYFPQESGAPRTSRMPHIVHCTKETSKEMN